LLKNSRLPRPRPAGSRQVMSRRNLGNPATKTGMKAQRSPARLFNIPPLTAHHASDRSRLRRGDACLALHVAPTFPASVPAGVLLGLYWDRRPLLKLRHRVSDAPPGTSDGSQASRSADGRRAKSTSADGLPPAPALQDRPEQPKGPYDPEDDQQHDHGMDVGRPLDARGEMLSAAAEQHARQWRPAPLSGRRKGWWCAVRCRCRCRRSKSTR
jgi:hypothetical protein